MREPAHLDLFSGIGGFCVAGKRRGKADDRHLWPAMCAVIERCKPTFVLGENGIINMELDACISDLEAIGYTVQPFTVPACAVGSPTP